MMLDIKGLQSGYGAIGILRGVDLSLRKGEFVGLWGHNGVGKSTLMRTIAGHIQATAGSLVYLGTDLTTLPTHKRAALGIGFVPQGREIFPAMSVMDNLRMGCLKDMKNASRTIEETLSLFPRLVPLLGRIGGQLSGGEQQLLALARCLCGKPGLVLLDEPTEGIQPSIIAEMVDTLHAVRRQAGLTMVVVEQNQEFIAALSDRVLVMQKGQLTRELSPAAFLEDPELV